MGKISVKFQYIIVKTSFYTSKELKKIGLRSYGQNVLISKKTSIYGAENIVMGSNVRIDDYCILSGTIEIGSYIHIAAYCGLYGKKGIFIKDFSGLSAKVIIYSAIDDFSGKFMVGPVVPTKFTNVTGGPVILNKFVQIGAGSIIMPSLVLEEGAAVGAMTFVNKSLTAWTINAGIPVRFIKKRNKNILKFDEQLKKVNNE